MPLPRHSAHCSWLKSPSSDPTPAGSSSPQRHPHSCRFGSKPGGKTGSPQTPPGSHSPGWQTPGACLRRQWSRWDTQRWSPGGRRRGPHILSLCTGLESNPQTPGRKLQWLRSLGRCFRRWVCGGSSWPLRFYGFGLVRAKRWSWGACESFWRSFGRLRGMGRRGEWKRPWWTEAEKAQTGGARSTKARGLVVRGIM